MAIPEKRIPPSSSGPLLGEVAGSPPASRLPADLPEKLVAKACEIAEFGAPLSYSAIPLMRALNCRGGKPSSTVTSPGAFGVVDPYNAPKITAVVELQMHFGRRTTGSRRALPSGYRMAP